MKAIQRKKNQIYINAQQTGAVKQNLLLTTLITAAILIGAWYMLPPGYSTDTTLIGKGKPAIVLIYDADNAASNALMEGFNQVRGDYQGRVEFLIVDVNAPGGRQFANTNAMATAGALFFSGEGRKITALYEPKEKEALHNTIRQAFSF